MPDTKDPLYPAHAETELVFDSLTVQGRKYKASNVNRCADCNNSLMFRHNNWAPDMWECDNCGSRQTSK